MNRLHLILVVAAVVLVAALLSFPSTVPPSSRVAEATASPAVFVVRDVRLFDGERFHARQSVLVRDGLIVEVGEAVAVPAGAAVIDGSGHTLLPGLIDAHVHTWGSARRDALRFGVTTMLDMFSDPSQLPAARAERESLAATDSADLWSAGTLATAAGGHGTQYGMAIDTLAAPADAAAWVSARQSEGSDYIKIVREDLHVYADTQRLPSLDAATAAALVREAHARGLRAVMHVSAQDAARESLRDGADGLVHVFQDEVADAELVALARERGAFVVPTLTVVAGFAGEHSTLAEDPAVAPWLSSDQRQSLAQRMGTGAGIPALLGNASESVRRLHAAGVPILAGTDAPNPDTAHGASMHDEIVWLGKAGLEPRAALAAATSAPADAFGLADRGRIRPGLRADLLLVAGDLSVDPSRSRAIVTIWKNGRVVDRRPSQDPSPVLSAGLVSDFDGEGLDSRVGSGWLPTSDRMAGGQSQARIERIDGGAMGSTGALRASGSVHAESFPRWAGAFFNPGEQMMQALDGRALRELVFQARGDGRALNVLLFSGAEGSPPAVVQVSPGADWREFRVPLVDFPGADGSRLRGFAFTVDTPGDEYRFDLDLVEIR